MYVQQRPAPAFVKKSNHSGYQSQAGFQEPHENPQPGATYVGGIRYTYSESVDKNYTVEKAVEAASTIYKDRVKENRVPMNTTFLAKRQRNEKITLVEMNDISTRVLNDTFADMPQRVRTY